MNGCQNSIFCFFKSNPKVSKYLGYFLIKFAAKGLSKIAQSGRADSVTPNGRERTFNYEGKYKRSVAISVNRWQKRFIIFGHL